MIVKFWGVRGSIPVPMTNSQLHRKISAVVQRIKPEDLKSPESREKFMASLPDYIFSIIGGNTTCLEVRLDDDNIIIFDAGTGIRELGLSLARNKDHVRHYHIFFTHFHWDHLQGLPFFSPPVYDKRCKITFYSPISKLKEYLLRQMEVPYFPITMDFFDASVDFVKIPEQGVMIGNSRIIARPVKHPGGCNSYKVIENGKSMIFSTDTELREGDFEKNKKNIDFYKDTDLIVLDTQYTLDEAIEKYDWGHSSFSLGVEFAAEWKIGKLVMFHHEPLYEDKKLFDILDKARWYAGHLYHHKPEVLIAKEGLEIKV
jgi:phosphoribosyl 1,2-cyclic phosphodiesterase